MREEARLFGGWTVDKLELVTLYHKMYKRVAGGGTYIDGFGGTGTVRIRGEVEDRPGSVLIAATAGRFARHFVYEKSPQALQELKRNVNFRIGIRDRNILYREGDFNTRVREDLDAERVTKTKPCLAFLDPDSTQLGWETIEAIAAYKGGDPPKTCKVELFILFNTDQALVRLVPRMQDLEYPDSAMARRLDWVMGGRASWQDLNGPHFTAIELMRRYRDNLTSLGYPYVMAIPIQDPKSGSTTWSTPASIQRHQTSCTGVRRRSTRNEASRRSSNLLRCSRKGPGLLRARRSNAFTRPLNCGATPRPRREAWQRVPAGGMAPRRLPERLQNLIETKLSYARMS